MERRVGEGVKEGRNTYPCPSFGYFKIKWGE